MVEEDELLPTARKMAASIAGRKPEVVKLVKRMQHEGQAFSVPDALQYELRIAAQAYAQLAQGQAQTRNDLSSALNARAKL